jgi:hypothetical protein
VERRGGVGPTPTWAVQQLVHLVVPKAVGIEGEADRLPCRVTSVENGAYTLLSYHGPLRGVYYARTLEAVAVGRSFGIPGDSGGQESIALEVAVQRHIQRRDEARQRVTRRRRKRGVALR